MRHFSALFAAWIPCAVAPAAQAQEPDPTWGQPRPIAKCHVDVACPAGAAWADASRSIVQIYAFKERCTGVLLNNTAQDGTPYVLTARHCGDLTRAAFFLGYKRTECGGESPKRPEPIFGAEVVVYDDLLDFQLVRLSATPSVEPGVLYAGWDAGGEVPKGVTSLHHPQGDVMKIAHDEDEPKKDSTFWRVLRWEVGITEKGSSGAPLFDAEQRVVGQLAGGNATCKDPSGDLFGRLEKEWFLLRPFLDPLGLGVTRLDALDTQETPLAFDLLRVEPSSVALGRRKVGLIGMAFSPDVTLYVDGAKLPRAALRYRTNSRLDLDLPADLALGEHTLAVQHRETGEMKELVFTIVEPPAEEEGVRRQSLSSTFEGGEAEGGGK